MGRYWALGIVVVLAVLARPDALVTFSVLTLAAGLGGEGRPLRPRFGAPFGKRDW